MKKNDGRYLNRGNPGNAGGGRPKLESIKTVSDFRQSKIKELPKIWKQFDEMLAREDLSDADRIRILSFKFEHLAGKPAQQIEIPQLTKFVIERPT